MSEQPAAGRDVLAELDSIEKYLLGLVGENPLPGLDVAVKDLTARLVHFRPVVQNIVELAAEYASGTSHKDRLAKSMGQELSWEQVRHMGLAPEDPEVARLREENAALRAAQGGQA